MPIHSSWKSMASGMKSTYCKGKGPNVCREFTDGKKVCMCEKAWNVFFATVTKRVGRGGETKPMPKTVEESLQKEELINWFMESLKSSDINVPNWVALAKKAMVSKKLNEKVKTYWKKRLQDWCSKNKGQKICEGV